MHFLWGSFFRTRFFYAKKNICPVKKFFFPKKTGKPENRKNRKKTGKKCRKIIFPVFRADFKYMVEKIFLLGDVGPVGPK